MKVDEVAVGDLVCDSPVGCGEVTSISNAGYPRVNHIAVVWLERPDGLRWDPFDRHGGSRVACPDSKDTII